MLCGLKITGIFQSTLPARGATPAMLSARPRAAFQSTLPARGATDRVELKDRAFLFQSTLPARGATLELLKTAVYQSFQSTLPARGATRGREANTKAMLISIHAPRTGSDLTPRNWNAHQKNFNPRSPHGERRLFVGFAAEDSFISIHAPRTGSDAAVFPAPASPSRFQSTLPARGATQLCSDAGGSLCISIHAPRTGSDSAGNADDGTAAISIHAPRTGSDCGGSGFLARVELISIHAPRTGSDTACWATAPSRSNFNPRSPHGERPWEPPGVRPAIYFNPRSPHGERLSPRTLKDSPTLFQSTLPARGATYLLTRMVVSPLISIHAPRTGSDTACWATAPSRSNFNPRSPHGERPPHRRFQPP